MRYLSVCGINVGLEYVGGLSAEFVCVGSVWNQHSHYSLCEQ